jgi:hypothetical protein
MIRYEIERATIGQGPWYAVYPAGELVTACTNRLRARRMLKEVRNLKSAVFAYRLIEIDESKECRRRVIQ